MASISLRDSWFGKSLPVYARFKNEGGGFCLCHMIPQLAVDGDVHGPMAVSTGGADEPRKSYTM